MSLQVRLLAGRARRLTLRLICGAAALALASAGPRCAAAQSPPAHHAADALRVMTFNLRYASAAPPNAWVERRPVVHELLEQWAPDVIGTQEGLYAQLQEIAADLPDFTWLGVGRDGGSRGEFMAVFYRPSRLVPVEFDHYWLSDTPALIGSRTWGNRYSRMVTWIRFRDVQAGGEFYLVNTHFDHEVDEARQRSALLVLQRTAAFDPALPVLLLGDFNADAGASRVYDILVGEGGFTDTWPAAGMAEPPFGTYHAFGGVEAARGRGRIDWILTRGPVRTVCSEIVTFQRDGQFPSDHFAVLAVLRPEAPGASERDTASHSQPVRQARTGERGMAC